MRQLTPFPSVEASVSMTLPVEAYERLVNLSALPAVRLTFERRIHKPGPRCLWGWRKGLIQVGSPQDADDMLRLDIPHANFEASHV